MTVRVPWKELPTFSPTAADLGAGQTDASRHPSSCYVFECRGVLLLYERV